MKRFVLLSLLALVCAAQTSCQRSAGDVWEDTKSCGRHMSRGFRTLSGSKQVSRQVEHPDQFDQCEDNDYIPLRDSDIAQQLRQDGYTPPSSQSPGEAGSYLPGIDGFASPMTGEQLNVFQHIHFDKNQYSIKGAENRQIIENIAAYMQSHPNLYIFIEGHCDKTGSASYNMALGNKRANSVRTELINAGVNSEHVFTISYGKERPLVEGDDLDTLRLNRRGEFKLYFYN